jgi:hypothetical protein
MCQLSYEMSQNVTVLAGQVSRIMRCGALTPEWEMRGEKGEK